MAQTDRVLTVRISENGSTVVPSEVLEAAGLHAGDDVSVRAARSGCVEIRSSAPLIHRWAGSMPAGAYPPGYPDDLRNEWER